MAIDLASRNRKGKAADHGVGQRRFFAGRGVSANDRMFFTERLALYLETGGVLYESLLELSRQADNPRFGEIVQELARDVLEGRQFSESLSRFPEIFPAVYVNLVAAGEQGGFLDHVLAQLREMEERRTRITDSVLTALAYPAFLILFSIGVTIFILLYVFPKFGALFLSIRSDLPLGTVLLLKTSDALRRFWPLFLLALAAGGTAAVRWFRTETGGRYADSMKLRLPVIRNIFLSVYLINFFRTVSMSLENGVSLLDALKTSAEVVPNVVFADFVARVSVQVAGGGSLAGGFIEEPFIPAMVGQMIRTGEESGRLSHVMKRVAEFHERQLDRNIQLFGRIVEPVMLLLMGALVGFLVSSLILPIFKLSRAVH